MKQLDKNAIAHLDQQIKSGEITPVQAFLEKLDPRILKRSQLHQVANIARRAGFHRFALKLLHSTVRSEEKLTVALPEEKIEYAAALIRARALNEASILLSQIDSEKFPQALLQLSMLKAQTWNYDEVIPLLEKYLTLVTKSSYDYFVASVNLAHAYHFAFRDEECLKLIGRLIAEIKDFNFTLLYGNILEIKARALFALKNISEARQVITEAKSLLKEGHYRYAFYLDQLNAHINLIENPNKKNIEAFVAVRDKALKHRLWEVVRECDLILAIIFKDEEKINRVYVGSQYEKYRERIKKLVGEHHQFPDYIDFQIGDGEPIGILDLEKGELLNSDTKVPKGRLVHKLLQILLADQYHNYKTESLFPFLYPGEYFDPNHFHHRIHNVKLRLREWLQTNSIPLEINESHEEYKVAALKPIVIRIAKNILIADSSDHFIKQIQEKFGGTEFSSQEVAKLTSVSLSTSKRILNEAVERSIMVRVGKSRATRYRFAA
jgi:hypothetical protein